jgi:hypothetical protein
MQMADRGHKMSGDSGKRQRVETPTGTRYVERESEGKFKDVQDIGRAATHDNAREAENRSTPGRGNRGDRD